MAIARDIAHSLPQLQTLALSVTRCLRVASEPRLAAARRLGTATLLQLRSEEVRLARRLRDWGDNAFD